MTEFMALIGQIFLITCLQSVLEMFITPGERPYLSKILAIACYAGALYLVLQFVFQNLVPEMLRLFRFG